MPIKKIPINIIIHAEDLLSCSSVKNFVVQKTVHYNYLDD